jgi:hypothetical protein
MKPYLSQSEDLIQNAYYWKRRYLDAKSTYEPRICILPIILKTVNSYINMPPYLWVIRSKSYRGYVKPRIIPNAIFKVIFV